MKNREKNWRRDPFYWGSLTLVLLLMGLIFYFSSQTGVQSGGSSGRLDALLLRWLYPDFSAYSAQRQEDLYFRVDFIVRKTAHVLEFAALGFALRLHLQAVGRWITIRHPQFLAWESARSMPLRTSCTSFSALAAPRAWPTSGSTASV